MILALILNADDLPYDLVDNGGRIYIGKPDDELKDSDLRIMEAELQREDRNIITPEIKEASKVILNTDKRNVPRKKGIISWKTKNESFLQLHEDLKILGIENNKFFLKLFDPDLEGVDPFLPNLPVELQIKIFFEVWINPWYYLREIARIPEDGKAICVGGGSEFKIDRNSLATWFCFLNGIDHYGSKPRQTGKTQDAISKQLYAFNWGCIATQFLFFNKDFPQAKVNLYRMKCQREMIPTYLKMEYAYTEDGVDKGINNVTSMRNPFNGNQIKCMTKATSVDIANSQGRGDTAAMHYMDEFDFWPYSTIIMNAAAFSYARASENAIKNNSLHCRICTSTPGFTSSRDGQAAIEFIDKCTHWEDKFLDLPINKIHAAVHSTKKNGFMYIEHTWKQLKKTQKWYERQCELVGYRDDVIAREIDLKRIAGNELNPLKKEHQTYITNNVLTPIDSIDYSNNLCPFYVFEKIHRDYPYLLIVDPAEGMGADHDNNAVLVLNPYTLRTVMEYKSPYVSQTGLFKMLDKLLSEWIPKACIIVEANKGRELINHFIESVWNYQLWYDEDKLNSKIVEVADEYGEAQKAAHRRRAFGFDTSPKTRPQLFRTLDVLAEEDIDTLCTPFVAKDVLGLIRKPTGRVEAGKGEHDDVCIAKLIGHFVYNNAKNLEEFGIVKGVKAPEELDRPLSEAERLSKVKEILPLLPPELQQMYKTALSEKNPVTEANKYYAQIEIERSMREVQERPINMNNPIQQRSTQQESELLWSQHTRELESMQRQSSQNNFNFYGNGTQPTDDDSSYYGGGKSFNVDDYL